MRFKFKHDAVRAMVRNEYNCIERKFYEPMFEDGRMWLVTEDRSGDDFYGMPMWSCLWQACSKMVSRAIYKHREEIEDAGFLIYRDDEDDIYLGINGAGYDFYEAHWNRLYDIMGLKWHDEE